MLNILITAAGNQNVKKTAYLKLREQKRVFRAEPMRAREELFLSANNSARSFLDLLHFSGRDIVQDAAGDFV